MCWLDNICFCSAKKCINSVKMLRYHGELPFLIFPFETNVSWVSVLHLPSCFLWCKRRNLKKKLYAGHLMKEIKVSKSTVNKREKSTKWRKEEIKHSEECASFTTSLDELLLINVPCTTFLHSILNHLSIPHSTLHPLPPPPSSGLSFFLQACCDRM